MHSNVNRFSAQKQLNLHFYTEFGRQPIYAVSLQFYTTHYSIQMNGARTTYTILPLGVHLERPISLYVFDSISDTLINVQSHFVFHFFLSFFMSCWSSTPFVFRFFYTLILPIMMISTTLDLCRMPRVWNVCDRVRERAHPLFYAKQRISFYMKHTNSWIECAIIERNHLQRAVRSHAHSVYGALLGKKVGQYFHRLIFLFLFVSFISFLYQFAGFGSQSATCIYVHIRIRICTYNPHMVFRSFVGDDHVRICGHRHPCLSSFIMIR